MPRRGLILINTGDGKGKTTAALGLAFRAVGHGLRVFIVQFIKGGWSYGELETAKRLAPLIEIHPMGEGFTWDTKNPVRDMEKARAAWEAGKQAALSGQWDIVVFDEINYVIKYDYLPADEVAQFLKQKPPELHVILTGRDAHPTLIALADTVTEMRAVKHVFDQGVKAQKGIEF